MSFPKKYDKLLLLFIGLFTGILSYWFNTYNDLNLLGIHVYKIMGVGSFLGSFIGMFLFNNKPLYTSIFITIGVLIGIVFRIFYDITFIDATSHNLFPFEIIIAIIMTFPTALIGAYLGFLIKKKEYLN